MEGLGLLSPAADAPAPTAEGVHGAPGSSGPLGQAGGGAAPVRPPAEATAETNGHGGAAEESAFLSSLAASLKALDEQNSQLRGRSAGACGDSAIHPDDSR